MLVMTRWRGALLKFTCTALFRSAQHRLPPSSSVTHVAVAAVVAVVVAVDGGDGGGVERTFAFFTQFSQRALICSVGGERRKEGNIPQDSRSRCKLGRSVV